HRRGRHHDQFHQRADRQGRYGHHGSGRGLHERLRADLVGGRHRGRPADQGRGVLDGRARTVPPGGEALTKRLVWAGIGVAGTGVVLRQAARAHGKLAPLAKWTSPAALAESVTSWAVAARELGAPGRTAMAENE